jgi:hypothetical protein
MKWKSAGREIPRPAVQNADFLNRRFDYLDYRHLHLTILNKVC